jgi:hypothetical protein
MPSIPYAPVPGLRIIFNVRDTETCIRSEWWAVFERKKSRRILELMRSNFRRYYEAHRSDCYWMPYEELRHDSEVLRGMFDFVGLRWAPEHETPLNTVMRI